VMLPLELAGRKDARKTAARQHLRIVAQALARAFVVQPALLLADEPTGSLDFATGEQVMRLMFDLNRELGTTLVLVTHDRSIAAQCEHRVTIEAGRVVTGDEIEV